MKKIVFVLMLMFSAGMIVSCGSEEESGDKESTEEQADKNDGEDSDKEGHKCKKDGKCCKKKGMMCDSRKALEEELSEEELQTIADARAKFQEVVGDSIYGMMANHMCDAGGKCCGKCKKDGKKCEHKHEEGEHHHADGKKCEHGDSAKCCKHGHGMMGMMHDMDSTQMQAWHDELMPTIESLMAVADAHADHFDGLKKMHKEKHGDMEEGMHDEMHDKMHDPEHMKQMMTVHYLLMDPSKCKKSDSSEE